MVETNDGLLAGRDKVRLGMGRAVGFTYEYVVTEGIQGYR